MAIKIPTDEHYRDFARWIVGAYENPESDLCYTPFGLKNGKFTFPCGSRKGPPVVVAEFNEAIAYAIFNVREPFEPRRNDRAHLLYGVEIYLRKQVEKRLAKMEEEKRTKDAKRTKNVSPNERKTK